MACLGETSRFRLARALMGGERCVSELAVEVGLSQSCTTRHLQALSREGLVRRRRDGRRVLFRLRAENRSAGELFTWIVSHVQGPAPDGSHRHQEVAPSYVDPAATVTRRRRRAGNAAGPGGVGGTNGEPADTRAGHGGVVTDMHEHADIAPDEEPAGPPRRGADLEDFLL